MTKCQPNSGKFCSKIHFRKLRRYAKRTDALVEGAALRYRLFTGPLRQLAEPKLLKTTNIATDLKQTEPLSEDETEAILEAETLNPFIPNLGV